MARHPSRHLGPLPTFIGSEQPLARYVARPVLRFIEREVASGVLLLAATLIALVWANVGHSYHDVWFTEFEIVVGSWSLELHLEEVVNDGLMTLFFFVVGLEIKRELTVGELCDRRAAALPGIAALGGMVVPALIFIAANRGAGDGAIDGWGVPMATDIAFALGVIALLGSRVSPQLKLFLLTLAIVDDIGAIVVVALFYTSDVDVYWLALAVAALALIRAMAEARVWAIAAYVVIGLFVWYATWRSGVHATIAGVALGLMTPAFPLLGRDEADRIARELPDDPHPEEISASAFRLRNSVGVAQRLENALHPWTSFLVVPIFALANAGIQIDGDAVADAASSSITWGIVLGLVLGKPLGVVAFTWIATRFGFRLPAGVSWRQFIGLGAAAGIGFTVSIFISGLAYEDGAQVQQAKLGILLASFIAAGLALLVLATAPKASTDDNAESHPADPDDNELEAAGTV